MKLNREKIAAFLAMGILFLGMTGVVQGFLSPVRGVEVPDVTLTKSSREVIPRKHRLFTEGGDASRNPFSFSEGWQRMEATPMSPPILPSAPRPVPLLWPGPSAIEAGFLWQDRPPAEIAGESNE